MRPHNKKDKRMTHWTPQSDEDWRLASKRAKNWLGTADKPWITGTDDPLLGRMLPGYPTGQPTTENMAPTPQNVEAARRLIKGQYQTTATGKKRKHARSDTDTPADTMPM